MLLLTDLYHVSGSLTVRMTLASGKASIRSLKNEKIVRFLDQPNILVPLAAEKNDWHQFFLAQNIGVIHMSITWSK